MVKEKESQRYLQDRLASFVDPLSLAIAFFEVFDKKEITSLDPYPELYLMSYQNRDISDKKHFQKDLLDLTMEWNPFSLHRESDEEERKALDQENSHSYKLHLYLYFDRSLTEEITMVKEYQRLSPSYQEEEQRQRDAFLKALKDTISSFLPATFLGYEVELSES